MNPSPTDYTAMDAADVFCGDRLAGRLRRRRDHTEFSYLPAYVREGGRAAAVSLPLREEPYRTPGGSVPAFFAGLLPEGVRLQAVITACRTSPDDEMSLLLAVGGDAVGWATAVPVGERPRDPGADSGAERAGGVSFGELFARSVDAPRPLLDAALPGVQEKLSDALISFPVRAGGGPAILKLSPQRYPRLVENEAFFLDMAEACGFRVPPRRVVADRAGAPGLLVERFDRVREGGRVARLPQEDVCQMTGRWPADKYRPSLREVTEAVTASVSAPAASVLELVRLTAFSYLIGNGDMHAKNISVRWLPGERIAELTPAYDLLSTAPYGLDDRLALHMDGRTGRIRGRDLARFAETFSVPSRLLGRKLAEMCDTADKWADRVGEIGLGEQATARLARLMRSRSKEIRDG